MPDCRPIGVFDSGLGGLTVTAAIRKSLPHENIVYLGDTARVPYGNKSIENIRRFGLADAAFLADFDVKALVVACNTVSTIAMPMIKDAHPESLVLDVVEAGVAACADGVFRDVAVIGTKRTVGSGAYECALRGAIDGVRVRSIACPLFVPLAEEGVEDEKVLDAIMNYHLSELHHDPPEALLLGCTHYPLLADAIRRFLPDGVTIIDSAESCAVLLAGRLMENQALNSSGEFGGTRFHVTDKPADFAAVASRFLGAPIGAVNKVSLGE